MDKELDGIKKKKMMELLNKRNETIVVRIFDALLPASGCSCGSPDCLTSPNMLELQALASIVIQKYGENRFRFELLNVLDSSIQKAPDVYNLLKEGKDGALPIITINSKIRFKGRVPSFEEFQKEIQAVM